MKNTQQLYVYVDESGQDPSSEFFVVVAVISGEEQEKLRNALEEIERETGTGRKKWHKVRHGNRMRYLESVMLRRVAAGQIYCASYRKPLPYFFPLLDILEHSLKNYTRRSYQAHIYVDGIDKQKALSLTNALRARGISLHQVKGRRDESEPVIRLADMWAGCIRSALLNHTDASIFFERAKKSGYVLDISPS